MPSVVVFFNRLLPAAFENLGGVLSWFDSFMRESLPKVVDGFREGYDTVRTFFQGTGRALRRSPCSLSVSQRVTTCSSQTILGPAIGGVFRVFGGALVELTDFFEKNQPQMESIGDTIGRFFDPNGPVRTTTGDAVAALTLFVRARTFHNGNG